MKYNVFVSSDHDSTGHPIDNVDKCEVTPTGAWVLTRGTEEPVIVAVVPPGCLIIERLTVDGEK